MFDQAPNPARACTLTTALIATALHTSGTNSVDAQSITLDVDYSDVSSTLSEVPRDYDFNLDLLGGIKVRAHLPGVEPDWNDWVYLRPGAVPLPGLEDRTWVDSHAGGYHETAGYSVHAYLTEEGEIAFNFQGFESARIQGFEIDLGWYFCFDRTAPDPGTTGSGPGRDITLDDTSLHGYAQSGDLDLQVTYQQPIRVVGHSVEGDVFEAVYIEIVDDLFQSTDAFGIVTDLDPRFDDPGPRYNHDASFDWAGHTWTPMYQSTPEIDSNGALVMCADRGMFNHDAVSFTLPADTCYFEMEIHDDWACGSTEETVDNSWHMQVAGDSGIPMGFYFGSSSTGKLWCSRYFDIKGSAAFSRLDVDADWYLILRNSSGGMLEIDLSDDWYLHRSPDFHLEGTIKSAGIGIKDNGDSLTLMNIDFEEPGLLDHDGPDDAWISMEDAIGVELRLRNLEKDEVRTALGSLKEGIAGVHNGCAGFGSVELTESLDHEPLLQDLNGDGAVNGMDIAEVLASWGACPGCPADFDGDGMVNGSDFALILAAWTG